MLIAFKRTIGTLTISMILDEDWDVIKKEMCDKWLVEYEFDRHQAWAALRKGQIIITGNDIYQVWDTVRQGEYADDLFQGRYIEVTREDLP